MAQETELTNFIVDWFGRFDRLEPPEVFLADLHPDVEWDMPDVDPGLSGRDRFRAWYAGVLATFQSPTEHHVSDVHFGDGTVSFTVLFRAQKLTGEMTEVRAREDWRFEMRTNGRPLIKHYCAKLCDFEASS